MEDYPQVVNALGTETIELYYIYSKDTKKNGKKSCAYSIGQLHEGVYQSYTQGVGVQNKGGKIVCLANPITGVLHFHVHIYVIALY